VRVDEPVDLLATAVDPGTHDGPWVFSLLWDGGAIAVPKSSKQLDPSFPIRTYAFNAPGTHQLTVSVTDKDGGVGSATATITVLPDDPGATQPGADVPVAPVDPATGASPVTLQFSNVTSGGTTTVTSASHGAPLPNGFKLGNPPTYYDVATTATFSGTITLCFTYPEGKFQIEAKLKLLHQEPSGAWVDVTTSIDVNTNTVCGRVTSLSPFVVAQENKLPVVSLAPASGREGSPVTFNASASDPDGTMLTWLWNFGDGQTSTDAQPRHSYADEGVYQVSVLVTDVDEGAVSATSQATVANVPPSVSAGAGINMLSGGTFTLSGSFSDPGVNDAPWTYAVSWGDGRTASDVTSVQGAITPSALYLPAGSYIVRLRVTDADGDAGEATTTVVVRRIPVTIDIKPGSSDNPIKLSDLSDAQIAVAVLSTATFDATTIDASSVSLASVNVSVKKNGSLFASKEDVNGDGRADLVLHFARADLVTNGDLTPTTTSLSLFGNLSDGRQVTGGDAVRPIP
jgi:PKD repeat protein